jgi:protein tyrosine phosphatase (PTP) superfamily phosphohydrolase (DUF442 family)
LNVVADAAGKFVNGSINRLTFSNAIAEDAAPGMIHCQSGKRTLTDQISTDLGYSR